jgi:hypothetical protein
MNKTKYDFVGKSFGRWTVINYAGTASGHSQWYCRCLCGTKRNVMQSRLLRGTSTSCGCWQKENARDLNTKHGMWKSSEYRIWAGLVNRCTNPNNPDYPRYGARGITVCDRWRHSFENFYADMGERLSSKYSIDRIDNNGNYSPDNCRWATSKQQTRNASYNVNISYNGRTQTRIEWAEELGVSQQVMRWRLSHWDIERAMMQPLEIYHHHAPPITSSKRPQGSRK